MTPQETEQMIMEALRVYHMGHGPGSDAAQSKRFTPQKYPKVFKGKDGGIGDRVFRLERKK